MDLVAARSCDQAGDAARCRYFHQATAIGAEKQDVVLIPCTAENCKRHIADRLRGAAGNIDLLERISCHKGDESAVGRPDEGRPSSIFRARQGTSPGARKASWRPSGESVKNTPSGGGESSKRIGSAPGRSFLQDRTAIDTAVRPSRAATLQASHG